MDTHQQHTGSTGPRPTATCAVRAVGARPTGAVAMVDPARAVAWATLLVLMLLTALIVAGCGDSATAGPTGAGQADCPQAGCPETDSCDHERSTARTIHRSEMTRALHERATADRNRHMRGRGASEHLEGPQSGQASETAAIGAAAAAAPADPVIASSNTVLKGGSTPLVGVWTGAPERLAACLLAGCPAPSLTVSPLTLAEHYVRYCAEAGLRADLLWAQMLLETGYGGYGGDVHPGQNNFAGLGATGEGAVGAAFPTAEHGVMAHVAHMVAYVYPQSPVPWANSATDPRFDLVRPRGAAAVLSDLDGRWAVPGIGYGERIEAIARWINAP